MITARILRFLEKFAVMLGDRLAREILRSQCGPSKWFDYRALTASLISASGCKHRFGEHDIGSPSDEQLELKEGTYAGESCRISRIRNQRHNTNKLSTPEYFSHTLVFCIFGYNLPRASRHETERFTHTHIGLLFISSLPKTQRAQLHGHDAGDV